MLEKIKCPERDSNPRHLDLMEGAQTTELPCYIQCIFGFKTYLQICCGHVPSAKTEIPALLFDPIMVIWTFIPRACNKVPRTGKHMNYDHQLDEKLAHAHFKYTVNKHEKTNYEFIPIGLLVKKIFYSRTLDMR